MKQIAKEIVTKCWNGHFIKIPVIRNAYVGSGYDNCNECGAVIVKRWVRRDPNKTNTVAEMCFIQ
jgi:hypothetical protein